MKNAVPEMDGTERLIAAVRGNPVATVNLARTLLLPQGANQRAIELCGEAKASAPRNGEADMLGRSLLTRGVGSWYFTMVQDATRHEIYDTAMRRMIKPGSTVLDIGAGTGVFAMMAARAGAGRVYACERHPAVADAARQVVAANGFADRVTVLNIESSALRRGVEIDEPVDLVLWDNLANNLFGVGAAAALEDAFARLAKPDAIVMPGRVEICTALVDCRYDPDEFMHSSAGFDVSAFNALRPHDVAWGRHRWEFRSEGGVLFDVTIAKGLRPERNAIVAQSNGGRVTGIIQWLRFHLADDLIYETDCDDAKAFGMQYHALDPFETEPGEEITIAGAHDLDRVWFWIEAS